MGVSRSVRATVLVLSVAALAVACKRGGQKKTTQAPAGPRAFTGDTLPPPEQQGKPAKGGTLRISMGAEPPSLNHQLDPLDEQGKRLSELFNDSLARPDPKTWEFQPHLAERWEISEDGLTFTFFLRKGVRWHDGKPFTADDVIFTFDKIIDPTSKTMSIRSFLEPLAKHEKVDAHTVRFTLKRPYWYAFDAVAQIFFYPKHVYEKGDFNTHSANRAPIGVGKYRFEHWKTGDEIVLVRNDAFYGQKAHLDRIVFKYAPDPTIRVQMVRRGDIDVVLRLNPDAWRNVSATDTIARDYWRLRHVPSGLQWIGWNQARPFFRDRRVRRALTMLIDRQDIVDNLRLGLDTPALSWFYPGTPEYHDQLEAWPYDPEAAIDLLEDAGWEDSDSDGVRDKDGKPFAFTFLYAVGNPLYEQLASLMQDEFKKAGLKMDTARMEWAVYAERLRRHEFDVCSLLWMLYPRGDPYQIWHSSEINGGSNFVGFNNPEADELLEDARGVFDETKRVAMYRRFSEILHEEQPYTMLFNRYNLSLVSKRFGNVYSTPYGVLRLGDFYLRQDRATDAP